MGDQYAEVILPQYVLVLKPSDSKGDLDECMHVLVCILSKFHK